MIKTKKTFLKLLFAIVVLTQTIQAQQTATKSERNIHNYPGGGHAVTEVKNGSNQVEDVGIGTTWDIGRKSKSCGGFGLCKCTSITFEYSQRVALKKNAFNATININAENVLLSRIDQMHERIINKYFGGSQIILEEDFVIEDPEVLKKLHIESYTIKKGIYKLKYNKKIKMYETTF